MPSADRPRVLIFIVAYQAEKTIAEVVHRIPDTLFDSYHVEVLIIDDASAAATFEGEFSSLTNSYAGKGVVRYTW